MHFGLPLIAHCLIECQDELLMSLLFPYDPDSFVNEIDAGLHTLEPSDRLPSEHCLAEWFIVRMRALLTMPLIPWVSIRTDCVVVGASLWIESIGCENGEGGLVSTDLAFPLLSDQGNLAPLKPELLKLFPGRDASVQFGQLGQESNHGGT